MLNMGGGGTGDSVLETAIVKLLHQAWPNLVRIATIVQGTLFRRLWYHQLSN